MSNPEILAREEIYRARVFNVSKATIREGETVYTREIIEHPGSVVIVPVFDLETVALVRQYRHPAQKRLLELPAGSVNIGEDLETGARRELEEEIGVTAGKIEKLLEFYVSPGFLSEKMHVFMATDLTVTAQRLEDDEILNVERYSFVELQKMIASNEIEDAKTMLGVTFAAARFGQPF